MNKEYEELKAFLLCLFQAKRYEGVVAALSALVGQSNNDISLQANAGFTVVFCKDKTSENIKTFVFDLKHEEDFEDALRIILSNI